MTDSRVVVLPGGTITTPAGFRAAGVSAGIKPNSILDLALVYSETPCTAAAMFTTNGFKAAPVLYDQRLIAEHADALRATVINSGCANACTGDRGLRDAETTARHTATLLGAPPESIAVMSTGVIGAHLPMDRLLAGLQKAVSQLGARPQDGHLAARAIMTTDTRPKEMAVRVSTERGDVTIAGMAKGAGMISPNMATLLCVLTSDARITPTLAQTALREAVETGFNMITVDGDMSTNDTALLLANGASGTRAITSAESSEFKAFCAGLTHIVVELAKALVRDGEGASHLVEIKVTRARSRCEAKRVAMAIAKSSLVKTAIYGGDANWGRIVCAAGYSGVPMASEDVSVWLGEMQVFRCGMPVPMDEERAAAILARPEIAIRVDLGQGSEDATVWTCDLTHQYVDINAHYRT